MEVSTAIRMKRAIRKFKDVPLPDDVVFAILNAGRRAQSSKNSQPWQFIAIRDRDQLINLSKCGNWATHLAGAALGVAILAPDPTEHFQITFDEGQAAAYMQLAAWELGIGSCLATIYDMTKARSVLGFPADLLLRFAISFGYPENAAELQEPPRRGGRRSLEEIVHWDRW